MPSEFSRLLPDARAFFNELAQDNTRDFFLAHKPRYEADLRAPALVLLDTISADLQRAYGATPTQKLFRPHRDVRFSKDKTPYHLHLHMLWSTPPVGWFLGIARDYLSVGGGVMGFDKDGLIDWREVVDGPKGDTLAAIISDLQSKGARLDEPDLKRVPAPYDKDHPQGDLLRRKSMTVWFDLSDADVAKHGLHSATLTAFEKLNPLQEALRDIF
ncbi:TIGR02453 family protein [Shimia sp. Alg240-R146]|uniref:TIGR02453 family protein n=1 Tax=Shimia sp. Alg240-R146 TaxID=2993449 RepID=UPI0022E60DB5|nr:TIGR02453 family protein [Shimia sp. Alg240-R146]